MSDQANQVNNVENNIKGSNSKSIRAIVAAILVSPIFLLPTCVGGFWGGIQLAIQNETANGGKYIAYQGSAPLLFFVLVRDAVEDHVQVKRATNSKRDDLIKTVATSRNLTFLIDNHAGTFGTGEIHDITGSYIVENINENAQLIVVNWDEMDDLSGVSTYIATKNYVMPVRFGIVGPVLMGAGILFGLGLVLICKTIGKQLKYVNVDKASRYSASKHYFSSILGGWLPGVILIYIAVPINVSLFWDNLTGQLDKQETMLTTAQEIEKLEDDLYRSQVTEITVQVNNFKQYLSDYYFQQNKWPDKKQITDWLYAHDYYIADINIFDKVDASGKLKFLVRLQPSAPVLDELQSKMIYLESTANGGKNWECSVNAPKGSEVKGIEEKYMTNCATTTDATATDAMTMSSQISNRVDELFYQRDYQAINKIDEEYRNYESRLPDGRWKISMIYTSLGSNGRNGASHEWELKLELVNEWISKTPLHPAPYIAKSKILVDYAWNARGSGWTSSVTEPQWKLFHSRISSARKVLEDSIQISGSHPYWYFNMEVIANAQGWPPPAFDALYRSAVEAYPTYYFIHFAAANYYLPRWHGSEKELRRFVDSAVEKSKDIEGLTLYTRIYWSQLSALKEKTFSPGYAEWIFMKQGFDDIMQDYPDSIWNLNAYAYYSCLAKDWNTTNLLLKKISSPHLVIWESKSKYNECEISASNPD